MPTYRAAVLGSPITHSLSPVIHNAGFIAAGLLDWEYGRMEIGIEELASFVNHLDDSWRGLSLTMPLKFEALNIADWVSEIAKTSGIANTLIRHKDGGWLADNTDIGGFVDALGFIKDSHTRAAVLGAGGSAQSAIVALRELGVTEVNVYARDIEKAHIATELANSYFGVEATAGRLSDWIEGDEPVVVSTIPAGADIPLPVSGSQRAVIMDVVYAGWPTPLAKAADAEGIKVVGGLDLLVNQAVRQFELFTGVEAPYEAMYEAGRAALYPGL